MHEPYCLIVIGWLLWQLRRARPFSWLRRQFDDLLDLLAALFDAQTNFRRRRHHSPTSAKDAVDRRTSRRN
jgi:hypothetical protein